MIDLGIPGLSDFERIGAGGSASVFRAHRADGSVVAVKLLKWSLSSDVATSQFEREREALALLKDHPGIVTVLESGLTDRGEPYLVMPMMARSAQAALKDGPMPWREAVELTANAADAIDFAHDNGLIHRDIKPANILIDHDGNPKIADFGVAKLVDMTQSASSDVVATPSFIAPERYAGGAATEKGDVYSLAATLWNLVTGIAPFSEGDDVTPMTVMRRVLDDRPASLVQYGASPAVARVVDRALDKDPAVRPATAGDFAAELRTALEAGDAAIAPRRGGAVAATLVVAAAALALLAWVGLRDTSSDVEPVAAGEEITTASDSASGGTETGDTETGDTETSSDEAELDTAQETTTDATSATTEVEATDETDDAEQPAAADEAEETSESQDATVADSTSCQINGETVATVASQLECDVLGRFYDDMDGPSWVGAEGWMTATDPCTWMGMKCDGGALVKIDVRDMGITGELSPAFLDLPDLQQLIVSNNSITGEIPAGVGNLKKLRRFVVANNSMTGPIPAELAELPQLVDLYLENNNFSGELPPELGNLSTLQDLFINGNQLTGPLPTTFGNLESLVLFGAAENQLSGPIPDEIGNLTNLTMLALSANKFDSIPSTIGDLQNLTRLEVAVNEIPSLPVEVGNLSELERLFLNNNQLTEIPSEVGNLSKLARLELVANNLTSLPPEIGNLTMLSQVDLRKNLLTGDLTDALRGAMESEAEGERILIADGEAGNECVVVNDDVIADWLTANDPGWNDCPTSG